MEITFMNSFCQRTRSISKFIQSAHTICMLKQEGLQHSMELCNEILKENKLDFLLFWLQIKNSFVIALFKSFSSKFAVLICCEQTENHMYAMSMDGRLLKLIQSIGMIALLFWRKKYLTDSFLREISSQYIRITIDFHQIKKINTDHRWIDSIMVKSCVRLFPFLGMEIDRRNWN